ncbi:MAG: hypothetical protein ABJE95_20890 [Byssovorax sp.]
MTRPKKARSADPFRRRREMLLAGLGISPDSAARFMLPSRALPYLLPLPIVVYFALNGLRHAAARAPLALMIFFAGLALTAVIAIIPSRLTVGVDGIHLAWIGRSRFIQHEDIVEIVPYDFWFERYPGIRVLLRSGESIFLCTSLSIQFWIDRWGERDAILALVENERKALRRSDGEDRGPLPELLTRSDLSHAAWIRALRSIGAGANATLRVAPMPAERLLAVVEDPRATPAARTAAAIAVSRGDDAETRRRVAAASEATGDPTLKRALRVALSDDEAALVEALAEAEALGESARRLG